MFKRISILLLSVTLTTALAAATAEAQQVPDDNYNPPIANPAYPAGGGPVVAIDEAHFNFHTMGGRFGPFARLLQRDGYVVRPSTSQFSAQCLRGVDILVIANPLARSTAAQDPDYRLPTPSAFTDAEIEAVRTWVQCGGSLFLIADHMPWPGAADKLATAFGVRMLNGYAMREPVNDENFYFRRSGSSEVLGNHPITNGRTAAEGVSEVVSFTGSAFRVDADRNARSLLALGPDVVSIMAERAWTWDQSTPRVPVGGWSQGAVMRAGEGRVAVFGEAAMFTAQLRGPDRVPMGMNAPYAAGNHKFLLNVSHWLSGLLASNSSNPSPISIPTAGRATPYPATANVSGLSGSITDVNVTLHGVRHTWPDDLSILLVGPGKRKVMLMSDVGGGYWLNGLELTFDDEAPGKLPDSTQITAGRYLPTQGTVSGGSTASPASLPSPAPAGPYGTSLSAFKGADANGNYSLYVFDDATGDMGQIAAGFSLDIRTTANPG